MISAATGRCSVAASLILLFLLAANPLPAQVGPTDRSNLLAAIHADSDAFEPAQLPGLNQARDELLAQAERTRQDFSSHTNPANVAAWLKYLRLEPLTEALQNPTEISAQARAAIAVRRQLVGTWPGLERASLQSLNAKIDRFVAAIPFRDQADAEAWIGERYATLSKLVEQLDDVPTADDAATLAAVLSMFAAADQAPKTLAAFRSVFAQPNLVVSVRSAAVEQALGRFVDRQEPVRDCILGTRLVGQGYLDGYVAAQLLPSASSARILVSMNARHRSNSIGYNGPVRLRTVGSGDVFVSREIVLDSAGVQLQPAHAQVTLNSQIQSIQHPLKIVRRIAAQRAAEQKALAERIARSRLQTRIESSFQSETDAAQTLGDSANLAETRTRMQRLGIAEPTLAWSSTSAAMTVQTTVRDSGQLGAVVPPPQMAKSAEVTIQLHESLVDNTLTSFLSGRTVTQSQIRRLIQRSGRSLSSDSDGKQVPYEDSMFEIEFARLRPVIFEASDNMVRIGVRGTRFEQGSRKLERPLEVTAQYRPETLDDGRVQLVRSAEIDVDFPGRGRLTIAQVALRGTIKKLFADLFPTTLLDREITVPSTSQLSTLRGATYRARSFDARDGWMTVGLAQ